jgi:hypothetical protein
MTHRIRVLRMAADILEDEMKAAAFGGKQSDGRGDALNARLPRSQAHHS